MTGLLARAWILLMSLVTQCQGQTRLTLIVPRSVDACIIEGGKHPIDPINVEIDCLQRLLWYYQTNQNASMADVAYFSALSEKTMRRQAPETGFRTRKEYRTLTDAERDDLNNAFNILYQNGTIRRYAELHSRVARKLHGSPAFLPWYRVFLAHFEEELRKVSSRSVSLPYLDLSQDYEMDNPVNSVLWSAGLFGNANGRVVTGPFKGWHTAAGHLQRNYASGILGRLISKDDIRKIMAKCKFNEIVYPVDTASTDKHQNILEYHHQGILEWVGGDMANPLTSAYDPLFYMCTAYIDYLWETFRKRQLTVCHVDPEWDYPASGGRPEHGPSELMVGFDKYRHIDGLAGFWTNNWYNYADHPECPSCGGSKYLYCNNRDFRCVSHSRRSDYNVGRYKETAMANRFGVVSEHFEPVRDYVPKYVTQDHKVRGPFNDGRSVFTALEDAKAAVKRDRRNRRPTSRRTQAPRIRWRTGQII